MKNKRGWYIIIDLILSVMCLMLFLEVRKQNERNCQLLTVMDTYMQTNTNDIRQGHYWALRSELEQIKDFVKPVETMVITVENRSEPIF